MKTKFVYAKDSLGNEKVKSNEVGILKSKNNDELIVFFISANTELTVYADDIEEFDIAKTGDRYSHKVCDRCFRYLEVDFFSNNRLKKDNVITKRPSCKDCRKLKDGKAISKKDREEWEQKRPPIYSLFTCPICRKTSIVGISKHVLDHCHKTGNPRGYLCESCNTGIGRFDDDANIIRHAIDWLDPKNTQNK